METDGHTARRAPGSKGLSSSVGKYYALGGIYAAHVPLSNQRNVVALRVHATITAHQWS
jgi:hypothetical protein